MECKKCDIKFENPNLRICPYCNSVLTETEEEADFYNAISQDINEDVSDFSEQDTAENPEDDFDGDFAEDFPEDFPEDADDNSEFTEESYEEDYLQDNPENYEETPEDEKDEKEKSGVKKSGEHKKKVIQLVILITIVSLALIGVIIFLFSKYFNTDPAGPVPTTIVPIEQTAQINKIGNTNSNIVNRGLASIQGDTIYYAVKEIDYSKDVEHRTEESGIYSMRADGTGSVLLCNAEAEFLNVVGDYIYFSNLNTKGFCRMKTDGSDLKTIFAQNISYVTVTEDAIYYINSDNFSLNKMNLDGTGSQRMLEDSIAYYTLVDDTIYYKLNVEDNIMYTCDVNGQNQVALESYIFGAPIVADKDNIYCNNGVTMIFRTRGDASGETVLYDDIVTGSMALTNNQIYFSGGTAEANALQKMNLDGSGRVSFYPRDAKYMSVAGDFIFCLDKNDMTYVVRNDGTGFAELSKPRDKKSEEYMRAVLQNATNQEIISFYYMDYDETGDESCEAFALVGKYSKSKACYIGELWFVNTDKASKIKESADYSSTGELINFETQKKNYFKIESQGDNKICYIYEVENGTYKENPLSGKGKNFTVEEDGTIFLWQEDYDASVNGSGYTKKKYYFYCDSLGFHEYGGLQVDRASFERIYGANAILRTIEYSGNVISGIFYRSNGTFTINYMDKEWQNYSVYRYENGSLVKVEDGEGVYESAIVPSVAVYPTSQEFAALLP